MERELVAHGLITEHDGQSSAGPPTPSAHRSFNVWLHIVNGCNFKCFYCYIPELQVEVNPAIINRYSMSNLTADLVIDRLLEFVRSHGYQRLHIKFAGGEPTLNILGIRRFCIEMLRKAEAIDVSFGMISNGSFAADSVIPLLQEFKIGISVSIDGYHDSHDRVRFRVVDRRKVGTWLEIEQNLDRLIAVGTFPYLLFTVTHLNCDSLLQFADWAHSRLLGFRISPVRLKYRPSHREIDSLIASLSNLYTLLPAQMPLSMNLERDARFAEWNLRKRKISACGSCRNYLAVDERGQIKACQMSISPGTDASTHSIDDALQRLRSDSLTQLISQPELRHGACSRCEFFHVCTGGCPQHTLSVFGTIEHPSPWCEVFGAILPVYISAKAKHMWRQYIHQRAATSSCSTIGAISGKTS
jgi:uncharacterized protein